MCYFDGMVEVCICVDAFTVNCVQKWLRMNSWRRHELDMDWIHP